MQDIQVFDTRITNSFVFSPEGLIRGIECMNEAVGFGPAIPLDDENEPCIEHIDGARCVVRGMIRGSRTSRTLSSPCSNGIALVQIVRHRNDMAHMWTSGGEIVGSLIMIPDGASAHIYSMETGGVCLEQRGDRLHVTPITLNEFMLSAINEAKAQIADIAQIGEKRLRQVGTRLWVARMMEMFNIPSTKARVILIEYFFGRLTEEDYAFVEVELLRRLAGQRRLLRCLREVRKEERTAA